MNPEEVKRSISYVLNLAHKGRDVKVNLDKVGCGIWLWDEKSETHVRFSFSELVEFLGPSDSLMTYVDSLPIYNTSWHWINPRRMRMAL